MQLAFGALVCCCLGAAGWLLTPASVEMMQDRTLFREGELCVVVVAHPDDEVLRAASNGIVLSFRIESRVLVRVRAVPEREREREGERERERRGRASSKCRIVHSNKYESLSRPCFSTRPCG